MPAKFLLSRVYDKSGTIDAIELQDVLCKLGFSVNPLQPLRKTWDSVSIDGWCKWSHPFA